RVPLRCELSETERECPSCHGTLKPLAGQVERSEMIDVVELKYQVVEVERQKYVCACGGAVETAPGPVRAVDGGRYSLRFAIKVAFDKYVAHLPLERQARLMAHHGLKVTSQALWDQCSAVTELLAPTYDALFALLRASPVAAAVADVVRDRARDRLSPDLRRQVGADLQGPAGRLPGLGGGRCAGVARGRRARMPRPEAGSVLGPRPAPIPRRGRRFLGGPIHARVDPGPLRDRRARHGHARSSTAPHDGVARGDREDEDLDAEHDGAE